MRVELTQDWPFERVAAYGPQITAAMVKLVGRFPSEFTVKSLFEGILSGKNQLWLILDDDDGFLAFVMTEIRVNDATGHKSVLVSELAGEGGADVVSLIPTIEEWAKEQGAADLRPMGRRGWEKALRKQGYALDLCLYRKELA